MNFAKPRTLFVATVLGAGPGAAQELEFRGELSLTGRHFLHDGLFAGQSGSGTSIIPETKLGVRGSLGFADFEVEVYGRGDDRTGTELFDVQKAYIVAGTDRVTVLLGSDVVFWGTAESFNPTNILNQDDLVANPEDTRKLGQPMLNVSFEAGALGTMDFYGLFGFREPDLGSLSTRPRRPFVPDVTHAIFERPSDSVDFAFRNTNTIGFANGSLDYALSYFAGTDRSPVILPGCANLVAPVTPGICAAINADIRRSYDSLRPGAPGPLFGQVFTGATPITRAFLLGGTSVGTLPYYRDIQQVGLELAYASGNWVLKFEGAQRFTSNEDYFSAVAGLEYRFASAFGSDGDLTLAAEYAYDDRSVLQPVTIFDDDLFASVRYDFNNRLTTAVTLSGLYDLGSHGTVWNLDVSSRLTDSTRLSISATHVDTSDPRDPLTLLTREDFVELKLSYFF